MELFGGTRQTYAEFATQATDSPTFVAWTLGVVDDPEVLAWIVGLTEAPGEFDNQVLEALRRFKNDMRRDRV